MTAFRTWLLRVVCGLHGHDVLLQYERDRLSLRCVSCGHESPGWDLSVPKPVGRWQPPRLVEIRRRNAA